MILLVRGSTAPGVAQPFADTPAGPWALEAVAQPAAKGLIQGSLHRLGLYDRPVGEPE